MKYYRNCILNHYDRYDPVIQNYFVFKFLCQGFLSPNPYFNAYLSPKNHPSKEIERKVEWSNSWLKKKINYCNKWELNSHKYWWSLLCVSTIFYNPIIFCHLRFFGKSFDIKITETLTSFVWDLFYFLGRTFIFLRYGGVWMMIMVWLSEWLDNPQCHSW